jgi:hypothetical protein
MALTASTFRCSASREAAPSDTARADMLEGEEVAGETARRSRGKRHSRWLAVAAAVEAVMAIQPSLEWWYEAP